MAKEYAPFVRKIEVEVESFDMVKEAVEEAKKVIQTEQIKSKRNKKQI